MEKDDVDGILWNLLEAQKIARTKLNINNILQPGIVKELMMARILGHRLVRKKRDPDAVDAESNYYEYLCSVIRKTKDNRGSSFQIDRVTLRNLNRITRNKCFYFGFFRDHLNIEEIWRVETSTVLKEVTRQLKSCKNPIAHVNFLTRWVHSVGKRVYP
jgi:hypothetical protein